MLTPGPTRVVATAWAVGVLLVAPPATAAAPHGAHPAEPVQLSHAAAAPPSGPCGVSRPASAGRLRLNPSAVERGGTVVAAVTELPRFPEQIVGAGSLEFFGFCLPSPDGQRLDISMLPLEGPVVVPLQVPEDTPLGRHPVEVVFSEGRGGYHAEAEDEVVLSATVEVTAQPPPLRAADPDTPPCGLVAGTPPSGILTVTPAAGGALEVRLDEAPARLRRGNHFSGHYVTCFAGRAVVAPRPVAGPPDDPPPRWWRPCLSPRICRRAGTRSASSRSSGTPRCPGWAGPARSPSARPGAPSPGEASTPAWGPSLVTMLSPDGRAPCWPGDCSSPRWVWRCCSPGDDAAGDSRRRVVATGRWGARTTPPSVPRGRSRGPRRCRRQSCRCRVPGSRACPDGSPSPL